MKPINILKTIKTIIKDPHSLLNSRFSEKFFTRNRKMSFSDVLYFFLDMQKTSLQTRLNQFFRREGQTISEQAFSKARNHFDHSPFETMVRKLVECEYTTATDLPLWNGYHLIAVDGSYLQLPQTKGLKEVFGERGGGCQRASAGISVLYDLLHGWPIDPIITHTDMNERKECAKHIDYLKIHLPNVAAKSVIILDRGYPAKELFRKMAGLKFLARCSKNFCKEVENAPLGDSTVVLDKDLTLRVYKFELKTGEIEILITNLFEVSADELADLYALRWGIETMYKRLKHQVCIEKFSGRTANAIRQDFWASMVVMIVAAAFEKEANKDIEKDQQYKTNKHSYKAKFGDLVVTLRNEFIFATLRADDTTAELKLNELVSIMAKSKSPVRKNRSFERPKNRYPSSTSQCKSCL